MKRFFVFFFLLLVTTTMIPGQGIRKAVWAGRFYEQSREILALQLDAFLRNVPGLPQVEGDTLAVIVPHAGYVYSGQTAAYGYRLVLGRNFDSVVVIGPSHRFGFEGCSIYSKGGFETPLGVAAVDESLASEISKASGFSYIAQAHEEEHSVEVQVPFIQKALPQAKIVPIVMGNPTRRTIDKLANALSRVLPGKKALVVASTDMSHGLSKGRANSVDAQTTTLIRDLKTDALIKKVEGGENILCGGGPVAAALVYTKKRGAAFVEILKYSDSAEAGGPADSVVGYLAAALSAVAPPPEFKLSGEEKQGLLRIARAAITQFVLEQKVLSLQPQNADFLTQKGVFVTIKKRGELRGCIGFFEPVHPLSQAVILAAVYACSRDSRFPPVSPDELNSLEVEISVLTPLQKIDNPRLVRVGKHGLVIARDGQKGLLLPQVAVDNNWTREIFLSQACLKAGLPANAWRHDAEIFVFEAVVFHE